jgi:O-antigen ligase
MRLCVIFVILMMVTWTFAIHVSAFYRTRYVALIVFAFAAPLVYLLRNDWQRTITFFRCWVFINLLVSLWALRTRGVGVGDFLADENDLALAMSMALPYPIFMASLSGTTARWTLIYRATIAVIVVVIIISFSRGGFLGLIAVAASVWLFSKRKLRNLLITLAIVFVAGTLILKVLPAGYTARLNSINDPTSSTRVERLRSWELGWVMWKHNPILGVGVDQFPWNAARYERMTSYWIDEEYSKSLAGREAHSLYFSLLAEMGLAGVIVFLCLLAGIVRTLISVIRASSQLTSIAPSSQSKISLEERLQANDVALLAKAILCSLSGYLVSGAFISVTYYPHIWLVAAFATIIRSHSLKFSHARKTDSTVIAHPDAPRRVRKKLG